MRKAIGVIPQVMADENVSLLEFIPQPQTNLESRFDIIIYTYRYTYTYTYVCIKVLEIVRTPERFR